MSYTVEEHGSKNTLDYRVYFKNSDGQYVSPFHDIPAWANEEKTVVNMVVEVPRWTNAKMEINKSQPLNPISQDHKKGKARFVHNCFPHHGYIWNYGAIPQTWENPETTDKHTQSKGDNDPVDICDIGERIAEIGEVKQVKVLGIMAMIDEGETDWKVIGIDVKDPLADQINGAHRVV
jgi:inorganic pyrophosphatase